MELNDECIREKCYCWAVSCRELEAAAIRRAEKEGKDTEACRIVKCKWWKPGVYQPKDNTSFLPRNMR